MGTHRKVDHSDFRTLDRRLQHSLKRVFGLDSLRPGQASVIESVLDGHDTLAVMPTGAGKSLCYQLPAIHLAGMTVVVSPLISLMKDQSDKLRDAGVATVVLNSSLGAADEREAVHAIESGTARILFVTPERLANTEFVAMLAKPDMPAIPLIVVDEAHCITQWGHDFRPAFIEIIHAIKALGRPPVLALTATATPSVVIDILRELDMRDPNIINTGVYRENLLFSVEQITNQRAKRARVVELARSLDGSGIVYCATIAECEAVHAALIEAGESAGRYHGRLARAERATMQDAFMENCVRVMVATNAFGMGIDKPDIRFVIHHQMPGSLEAYYQEAGRAGRDGGDARCVLLFELKDKQVQQFFRSGRYPGVDTILQIADALRALSEKSEIGTIARPAEALREAVSNVGANRLRIALALLEEIGVVRRMRRGALKVVDRADRAALIEGAAQRYRAMAEHDRAVLERMIAYAQSGQCRWRALLNYFATSFDDAGVLTRKQTSPVRPVLNDSWPAVSVAAATTA
jgi:ATP-dependent DNA helicase RecQ